MGVIIDYMARRGEFRMMIDDRSVLGARIDTWVDAPSEEGRFAANEATKSVSRKWFLRGG